MSKKKFQLGDHKEKKLLTLHIPHAALHSSLVAITWLAWQSMPVVKNMSAPHRVFLREWRSIHRSMIWFLQMAQLSTTMSSNQGELVCSPFTINKRNLTPCPKGHSIPLYNLIDKTNSCFRRSTNSSAFTFLTSKRAFPVSFSFLSLVFGTSSTSISSAMVFYVRINKRVMCGGIRVRLPRLCLEQTSSLISYNMDAAANWTFSHSFIPQFQAMRSGLPQTLIYFPYFF